jgi:hypothetical protein
MVNDEMNVKDSLKANIDNMDKHDLLKVYNYVQTMQKGNSCSNCGRPLGHCDGECREGNYPKHLRNL